MHLKGIQPQFVGIQPQKNVPCADEPQIGNKAGSVVFHTPTPAPVKEVKKPGRPKKTDK